MKKAKGKEFRFFVAALLFLLLCGVALPSVAGEAIVPSASGGRGDAGVLARGQESLDAQAYDQLIANGNYTAKDIDENHIETKRQADGADGLDSTDPSGLAEGHAEPPSVPPATRPEAGTPQLKNYAEWLEPFVGKLSFQPLDALMHSRPVDQLDGIVEQAVEYPREWPARWLDGFIPAYTGTGWMYDMFVWHPVMSCAAKDVLHVAVTVYDYLPEEMDAYIAGLLSGGFAEVATGAYSAGWVDDVRSFRGRGCTLNIVFARRDSPLFGFPTSLDDTSAMDAEQLFVQFSVDFDRDPYVLDPSPTADTELMNVKQSIERSDRSADSLVKMDEVTDSEIDEYGRQHEELSFPSQWPKHIVGDLIPEFVFPAILHSIEVSTPADNPSPDQALSAGLYIIDFLPESVEAYAQELVAFGYREIPPEEYTEAEIASAAHMDTTRVFELPAMRVYLDTYQTRWYEVMCIYLRFDGRTINFFSR